MRRTHRTLAGFAALGAAATAALLLAAGPSEPAAKEVTAHTVRIGTYDNRAIAMAWAASEYNPVKGKMAEMEKAKAEGDDAKVKELEHWGVTLQKKLHFQGFGHYPVDDLLTPVADKLPGVAEKNHLDAIVWMTDFTADGVQSVDVTDDLVRLFNPPEQVIRGIAQMKAHKPVPFETLIDLPIDQ